MDFTRLWDHRDFADTDVHIARARDDGELCVLRTERLHRVTLIGASEQWEALLANKVEQGRSEEGITVFVSDDESDDDAAAATALLLLESLYKHRLPDEACGLVQTARLLVLANRELCPVVVDLCVRRLQQHADDVVPTLVEFPAFVEVAQVLAIAEPVADTTCYPRVRTATRALAAAAVAPMCAKQCFWSKADQIDALEICPAWAQRDALAGAVRHMLETSVDLEKAYDGLKTALADMDITMATVLSLTHRHLRGDPRPGTVHKILLHRVWMHVVERFGDVDKVLDDPKLLAECHRLFMYDVDLLEHMWTRYHPYIRANHPNSYLAFMEQTFLRTTPTRLPDVAYLSDITAACITGSLKKVVGSMPQRLLRAWADNAPLLDKGLLDPPEASCLRDVTLAVKCGPNFFMRTRMFCGLKWAMSYCPSDRKLRLSFGDVFGPAISARLRLWNATNFTEEVDRVVELTCCVAADKHTFSISTIGFTDAELQLAIKTSQRWGQLQALQGSDEEGL